MESIHDTLSTLSWAQFDPYFKEEKLQLQHLLEAEAKKPIPVLQMVDLVKHASQIQKVFKEKDVKAFSYLVDKLEGMIREYKEFANWLGIEVRDILAKDLWRMWNFNRLDYDVNIEILLQVANEVRVIQQQMRHSMDEDLGAFINKYF